MEGSNHPADSNQEAGPSPFSLTPPDPAWEQERDARFAAFVSARLDHAEATGCTEERRWAAGVRKVFAEWDGKRELATLSGNDCFSAQISALGWALRCVAQSTWRGVPGWDPSFHPQAKRPEVASENPTATPLPSLESNRTPGFEPVYTPPAWYLVFGEHQRGE
jgi:hypothetical protein